MFVCSLEGILKKVSDPKLRLALGKVSSSQQFSLIAFLQLPAPLP